MDIINVYKEFKGLKNYNQKLKFFDHHFTLLPFSFPSFDVRLDFLLQEDGIRSLTDILDKERRKRPSFIKTVFYNEMNFVFDVNPYNSNVHTFNEYIISKFTCNNVRFNNLLLKITALPQLGKPTLEHLLAEVDSLIETVNQKIENKKDRTLENQFFNVFYSGFVDFTSEQVKKYCCKRKLIELYLYATGILFGMYKHTLLKQTFETDTGVKYKIL